MDKLDKLKADRDKLQTDIKELLDKFIEQNPDVRDVDISCVKEIYLLQSPFVITTKVDFTL